MKIKKKINKRTLFEKYLDFSDLFEDNKNSQQIEKRGGKEKSNMKKGNKKITGILFLRPKGRIEKEENERSRRNKVKNEKVNINKYTKSKQKPVQRCNGHLSTQKITN